MMMKKLYYIGYLVLYYYAMVVKNGRGIIVVALLPLPLPLLLIMRTKWIGMGLNFIRNIIVKQNKQ